jgi:hypothetical protein
MKEARSPQPAARPKSRKRNVAVPHAVVAGKEPKINRRVVSRKKTAPPRRLYCRRLMYEMVSGDCSTAVTDACNSARSRVSPGNV